MKIISLKYCFKYFIELEKCASIVTLQYKCRNFKRTETFRSMKTEQLSFSIVLEKKNPRFIVHLENIYDINFINY